MDDHPRILLIGRSGSGKSTALRDALSYLSDRTDLFLLFSPTTESISEFQKIAPSSCVHPGGLNLELVSEALRLNRELAERNKQREIMIVADDVSYDKQLLKSPVMRDIAMNGRPAKCGLAMTLQYCMDLGPDLRRSFPISSAAPTTSMQTGRGYGTTLRASYGKQCLPGPRPHVLRCGMELVARHHATRANTRLPLRTSTHQAPRSPQRRGACQP
jgi:hypothetical protein